MFVVVALVVFVCGAFLENIAKKKASRRMT